MNEHKTSKYLLIQALFQGNWLALDNTSVKICSIEREDGSGKRFNVTGYNLDREKVTIFVETWD